MTDHTEVLRRFRTAATKFIDAVDSAPQHEREAFLAGLSRSMIDLYGVALSLPSVKPETSGTDGPRLPIEKWNELRQSLREKIGPFDAYWEIFDSTKNEPPVQGTLSDDISDIYCDLKSDLQLEQGVSQADFLWELCFSFWSHWGKHLLNALVAIHDRRIEPNLGIPENR